jgi:hypothetical protein
MNGRIYDKKDSLGIPFYMPFTEHIELRVEQIDSRNIDKGLSLRNTSKGGCREFRFLNTVYVKSAGKKNFMKVLTHLEAMQKRLKVEM